MHLLSNHVKTGQQSKNSDNCFNLYLQKKFLAVFRRVGERIAAIGGAQDRAALMQDALDLFRIELARRDRSFEQAMGRFVDAEDFPTIAQCCAQDGGPYNGI